MSETHIFKNSLTVLETEEGFVPLRFTEKQLNVYAKADNLRIRSLCPAGICLDLNTNSKVITFDYRIKALVRKWVYFDVYLNDIFVDSVHVADPSIGEHEFFYELPVSSEATNRVTIYLPQNVQLVMRNITLSEGAVVTPAPNDAKNLLCLGDSITQGMDARRPSVTYPVLLSRYLGMNLLNHGVGGYVFHADSLDPELPYKPDVITVAYGTNDWGGCSSMDEFCNNYSAYMTRLVQMFPKSDIYVITPIWRVDWQETRQMGTFEDLQQAMCDIGSAYANVTMINGLELLPHVPDFLSDQVHPTDEGFAHMALSMSKQIKESLDAN